MKFKEVAHLYIGCFGKASYRTEDQDTGKEIIIQLDSLRVLASLNVNSKGDKSILWTKNLKGLRGILCNSVSVKPILRKTDSLNELEDRQACTIKQLKGGIVGAAESIVYLTSKHIDCFGLIESGEAIDASTLSPNPYL